MRVKKSVYAKVLRRNHPAIQNHVVAPELKVRVQEKRVYIVPEARVHVSIQKLCTAHLVRKSDLVHFQTPGKLVKPLRESVLERTLKGLAQELALLLGPNRFQSHLGYDRLFTLVQLHVLLGLLPGVVQFELRLVLERVRVLVELQIPEQVQ